VPESAGGNSLRKGLKRCEGITGKKSRPGPRPHPANRGKRDRGGLKKGRRVLTHLQGRRTFEESLRPPKEDSGRGM